MQWLYSPGQIYVQGLQDGRLRVLVYQWQNYTMYWLLFLVLGAAAYYFVARSLFSSAMSHGLRVGFSSVAAQVAGMFAVVIMFYVVFFFFSPAKVEAWFMELTLLIVWFFYFLFSYFTAPESR